MHRLTFDASDALAAANSRLLDSRPREDPVTYSSRTTVRRGAAKPRDFAVMLVAAMHARLR